jgi:hypothetical protein
VIGVEAAPLADLAVELLVAGEDAPVLAADLTAPAAGRAAKETVSATATAVAMASLGMVGYKAD